MASECVCVHVSSCVLFVGLFVVEVFVVSSVHFVGNKKGHFFFVVLYSNCH